MSMLQPLQRQRKQNEDICSCRMTRTKVVVACPRTRARRLLPSATLHLYLLPHKELWDFQPQPSRLIFNPNISPLSMNPNDLFRPPTRRPVPTQHSANPSQLRLITASTTSRSSVSASSDFLNPAMQRPAPLHHSGNLWHPCQSISVQNIRLPETNTSDERHSPTRHSPSPQQRILPYRAVRMPS